MDARTNHGSHVPNDRPGRALAAVDPGRWNRSAGFRKDRRQLLLGDQESGDWLWTGLLGRWVASGDECVEPVLPGLVGDVDANERVEVSLHRGVL